MKTQHNKLAFYKSSILELHNRDLVNVNGGSSIIGGETCSGCFCDATNAKVKSIVLPVINENNNQVM